jgi:hypothetical protein
MRHRLTAALGLVLVVLVALLLRPGEKDRYGSEELSLDPTTWYAPAWEELLGGDSLTPATAPDPTALTASTDLVGSDLQATTRLFYDLASASASGLGQEGFDAYFSRNHPVLIPPTSPRYCTNVSIRATSAYYLPLSPQEAYVKSLIMWTGTCPHPPRSLTASGDTPLYVNFLYAARHDVLPKRSSEALRARYDGWVPVRPAELPGSVVWQKYSASTPADFELDTLRRCSLSGVRVRIEVALAFDALCTDALAAGVALTAVEGYRTPQQQKALYDAALRKYGSERAARSRVAYSDGFLCESMHCAAEAVDLAPNASTSSWLAETVSCISPTGTSQPPCPTGTRSVSRLEQYGFTAPHSQHGYHLEYVLGTLSADAELYGDCTPGGQPVPSRIDLIFRCRLIEAGLGATLAEQAADEALLVASCTSGLDPGFVSFAGAYTDEPNPATGLTDDRTGLFGLSSTVVSIWVPTGESPLSASSSIDAAARIYVDERSWGRWGWDPFACAAADDGVVTSPVLSR